MEFAIVRLSTCVHEPLQSAIEVLWSINLKEIGPKHPFRSVYIGALMAGAQVVSVGFSLTGIITDLCVGVHIYSIILIVF